MGKTRKKCIECGSSPLSIESKQTFIQYKGQRLAVDLLYSRCPHCSAEYVTTEQILQNELIIKLSKQTFDGLMAPQQIRAVREKLGLTQEQAACVFGGGRNAFSKYERGEVTQSKAMDKLIRLCLKHPDLLGELLHEADIR